MKRIDFMKVAPAAVRAVMGLEGHVRKSGLDARVKELVYLRVSQINACAYCVDMHTKDLRAAGETDERLAMAVVWREARCFTPQERAAFAFAEAVTRLGEHGVPGDVYAAAHETFGEALTVELALAVATINVWNRMAITFQAEPGAYEPPAAGPR